MLAPAAVVAAAGGVALWRGRHGRVRVSSTLLWRGVPDEAAGKRRRAADPLWTLVLVAAVLAALAAARPEWREAHEIAPAADVHVVMRAARGADHADLFVKAMAGVTPTRVDVDGPSVTSIELPAGDLPRGATVRVPKRDVLELSFRAGDQVVARKRLTRRPQPPLAVYERGTVPAALRRVFDLQPGAAVGAAAPAGAIRVLLVAARPPGPPAQPPTAWPERDALVVFTASYVPTELGVRMAETPGDPRNTGYLSLSPPAAITAATRSPLTEVDGHAIPFNATVSALRRVEATPAWDAVLKAGEWPLVLVRRDTNRNVAYVYVGTDLSPGQTTWPLDVSFPLFFARLAEAMRGGGTFGDVEEWTAEDLPVAAGEPARAVPLSPWALGAAAGVVALAAAGLIARGGARR